MQNKGFTLIELLAVIIVLAIVALITTPVVGNIIEKSKKSTAIESGTNLLKTAEMYMISSKKDYGTIDVLNSNLRYNGKKPEFGEVQITKYGKSRMYAYIKGYCLTKSYDGKIIASKKTKEECKQDSVPICKAVEQVTTGTLSTGNFSYGDEYVCDLGDSEDSKNLTFFILDSNEDNVSLIMNQNLGSNVAWSSDGNNHKDEDETKQAVTAKNALLERTSSWIKLKQNQITLPTYNQIKIASGNKIRELPIWMYDYLDRSIHLVSSTSGYWTLTPNDTDSNTAKYVFSSGGVFDVAVDNYAILSIRPVIIIPKIQLS